MHPDLIQELERLSLRPKAGKQRCPKCKSRTPSLSLTIEEPDHAVWYCHRCGWADGIRINGSAPKWTSGQQRHSAEPEPMYVAPLPANAPPPPIAHPQLGKPDETYLYHDVQGRLLFYICRWEATPERDKQIRPLTLWWVNGKLEWRWKAAKAPRPLYRLNDLALHPHSAVLIVEGEKAADAVAERDLPGVVVTTWPGGTGQVDYCDLAPLKGRDVVLWPDADAVGRKAMREIAERLRELGVVACLVMLPEDLPDHFDLADEWPQGWTEETVEQLIAEAQPVSDDVGKENSHEEREGDRTEASPSSEAVWPELASDALHGLAGEVVRTIDPHTESDPAAILVQFLVNFGSAAGREPHFTAEADRHGTNLFAVFVGNTAKGRKGSSWGRTRGLVESADRSLARSYSGLSSGEGLIWQVRDPIERRDPIKEKGRVVDYETVETDPGVSDKRVLIFEAEFASVLAVLAREGNTLSAVIRNAWDTGNLSTLTKNSPAKATGAHISIIGHVTKDELLRRLDCTEAGNGFANRFLWLCVQRSKVLPEGGSLTQETLEPLVRKIDKALEFARQQPEMRRDGAAKKIWWEVYPELSEGKPGLLGAIIARAEAQVMRLALIYALLDQSPVIQAAHLRAALAVWEFCEASAEFIFGDRLGDPVADVILSALRQEPRGLTRTEISNLFGRHQRSDHIDAALVRLAKAGKAMRYRKGTSGRSAERWVATGR